jgi:hypothetical protein
VAPRPPYLIDVLPPVALGGFSSDSRGGHLWTSCPEFPPAPSGWLLVITTLSPSALLLKKDIGNGEGLHYRQVQGILFHAPQNQSHSQWLAGPSFFGFWVTTARACSRSGRQKMQVVFLRLCDWAAPARRSLLPRGALLHDALPRTKANEFPGPRQDDVDLFS